MARHRATRPSIASVISTTSTNGTRSRTKLSYEQNALLALAENNLKKNKKSLNISAIVKAAERRAHEQGLELGVRARPSIKRAVEKLSESGAVVEAPRKGRSPAEYHLTPQAVKIYNNAKSHRRSDMGIAKETIDTLKGNTERPNKRRRSSVSSMAASSPQRATITKLKAELATARSEIESLKKSNSDLLDQQLDDDDDDDIFGLPARSINAHKDKDLATGPLFVPTRNLSFLGNHPTRPTTPEPTEHGSPEYDAPGEFDFGIGMPEEMTPPSSSPPDAVRPEHVQVDQMTPQKSEMVLKMERLEAAMSELMLEKAQMAEEIIGLKNQVEHERQNTNRLTEVQHEADLVRVELAQASKDRDSALKEVSFLTQDNAALERRCVEVTTSKQQLESNVSKLNSELETHVTAEAEVRTCLADATQELEETKRSLALSQDEVQRLTEALDMAYTTSALLNDNLSARDATIVELQAGHNLMDKQLQTLRGEATTLRESLAAVQDRASLAEAALSERESQVLGLRAEQEAMRATIDGLQRQKSDLLSEKTEIIALSDSLKADAERDLAKINNLGREVEDLNTQIGNIRDDLEIALLNNQELRDKAEADNSTYGRLLAERDIHIAKLKSNTRAQAQQLAERQSRINQLDAALARSTETIGSLQSSQKTLEVELAVAKDTIGALNQKIGELEAKDQTNAKRIAELKSDLSKHKNSIEDHQDMISKLELQLEKLRNIELESLRRRRARIEAEAKRLRDEEADLTRETIDVDQWDEGLSQSRAARSSLAPSWVAPSSP
ncbi:Golgin subfamily A member 3 [Ceratobasidium sp. AG-Ba]|nr:Golgin subfamily A member 3 [Ceratobasidium sp. AG-Ba]QRW04831.1 Golgin subfamily A member 3 [Ceratobasidium sp. AG-Ba]